MCIPYCFYYGNSPLRGPAGGGRQKRCSSVSQQAKTESIKRSAGDMRNNQGNQTIPIFALRSIYDVHIDFTMIIHPRRRRPPKMVFFHDVSRMLISDRGRYEYGGGWGGVPKVVFMDGQ